MSRFRCIAVRKNEDDAERLRRLAERLEKAFREAFLAYVERMKDDETIAVIVRLLEQGRIDEALRYLDQFAEVFGPTFEDAFRDAAKDEMEAKGPEGLGAIAERATPGTIPQRVVFTFGGGSPRAAAIAQTESARLVREIADSTRDVVRSVVSEGMRQGDAPRDTARGLREAVGLTARQNEAVKNYERLLREGSKEALSRELRDKRFDRTIESGKPLSEDQIRRMVDAYRRKYLKYRTEAIARTEGLRASSLGRREGMTQTIEQLGLSVSDVEKTWLTALDGRERPTHRAMHRQKTRGMDGVFVSPSGARLRYPRDPAAPSEETVMCRCTETYRIDPM